MAFKLSIGYETISPERRDGFLEALLDLIDEHRDGADKATIKVAREELRSNGKRKIIDEQTIEPGMPMPDLAEFGLTLLTPIERTIENMRPKAGEGAIEFSANGRTARLEPRQ